MPAQRIVSNSGREATITAPRPSAATVPWAALLMLMPTVVQSPAVRPPANAFHDHGEVGPRGDGQQQHESDECAVTGPRQVHASPATRPGVFHTTSNWPLPLISPMNTGLVM